MNRVRLWMWLSVAAAVLLSAGGEPAMAGPSPASSTGEPHGDSTGQSHGAGGFDPGVVQLPADSPERAVMDALKAGDPVRARAFVQAALAEADPEDGTEAGAKALDEATRGRLLWLAAAAEQDAERAGAHYAQLADSGHPLSRWAALRRGELLLSSDPAQAAALATRLADGWAGAGSARTLQAQAQYEAKNYAQAEPLLRALIEQEPQHSAAASAAMPLAAILEQRGTPDALEEAIALYRRVGSRSPLSEVGKEAAARAEALVARLPPARRAAHRQPSVEDEFQRGQSLLAARYHDEARGVFEALGKRVAADAQLRCEAELQAGRTLVHSRQRKEAAAHMKALAERCDAAEVKAWARYYGGRVLLRSGSPAEATSELAALVVEAPSHRLADDALHLKAAAHRDTGDAEAARKALLALVEGYPDGDMHSEARFALAFDARARGQHVEALSHLDAALAEGPAEGHEGLFGRAAYWRARTLAQLGRKSEAVFSYLALARSRPLAYHAQQARARVRELDRAAAAKLASELGGKPQPVPLRFAHRAEMDSPAFHSALELLRVGDIGLARRELASLGALGAGADEDLLWLGAALLDRAGAHADASGLARGRLRGFEETVPQGRAASLWRIAYPDAYSPLIEEVARESGVPAAFIRAVAREESAFDPEAVSSANAIGLIQLMLPTARAHGKALGLPADAASLKRPEINLRIGAHFIAELRRRYTANPAVVPAAYNAGHGAANRWLRERPGLQLDEWIERIPYSETRRYTRRVLETYGIYHFLQTGQLPALPNKLPAP